MRKRSTLSFWRRLLARLFSVLALAVLLFGVTPHARASEQTMSEQDVSLLRLISQRLVEQSRTLSARLLEREQQLNDLRASLLMSVEDSEKLRRELGLLQSELVRLQTALAILETRSGTAELTLTGLRTALVETERLLRESSATLDSLRSSFDGYSIEMTGQVALLERRARAWMIVGIGSGLGAVLCVVLLILR